MLHNAKTLLFSNMFFNYQFLLSVAVGWFMVGRFWDSDIIESTGIRSQCSCPEIECRPCPQLSDLVDEKSINIRNEKLSNGYYRSYRYKPFSHQFDNTNRWRLLTEKHQYEMINQESKIGLNGMWRLEVNEVNKHAQNFIKDEDQIKKTTTGKVSLVKMHRHSDPFHGITYLVNYDEVKSVGSFEHTSVEMLRPYVQGKPKLIDITYEPGQKMINIISPLSKVTERFDMFLDRYENNVLGENGFKSGPVRILFVIFKPEGSTLDNSVSYTIEVLDKFKSRNPNALVEYVFTTGEFSRAVGLHTGVMQTRDDEIVLFLDVDLSIGPNFLNRVRSNCIPNQRVIFPIMFSQYDPEIMDAASAVNSKFKSLTENKMAINKETGFWIYYAFGVAAMYKKDYLKAGGFRLDIKGWGGEDVDLFKKMIADPDLDVMSMVDPDLIHIFHKRGCDIKLAPDQYAMCVGAWAETLGSQLEVATMYLHSHGD